MVARKDSEGKTQPLHWALTFNTSGSDERPTGNVYSIAGNIDTFCYEVERSVPIRHGGWRGSLTVGRIPADGLEQFERILSQIPVVRLDPAWNCQNWVRGLFEKMVEAGLVAQQTVDEVVHRAESGMC